MHYASQFQRNYCTTVFMGCKSDDTRLLDYLNLKHLQKKEKSYLYVDPVELATLLLLGEIIEPVTDETRFIFLTTLILFDPPRRFLPQNAMWSLATTKHSNVLDKQDILGLSISLAAKLMYNNKQQWCF